jgi:hypothetical protein
VTTPIARWARPGGGVVVPPRAPRLFPHFFNRVTYMTVAPAWLWLPSPHPPPLSSRSLLLSCVPRGRVALHHHHPTSQPTRLRVAAAAATVGLQSPRERARAYPSRGSGSRRRGGDRRSAGAQGEEIARRRRSCRRRRPSRDSSRPGPVCSALPGSVPRGKGRGGLDRRR